MLRYVLVSENYELSQWSDLPGVIYGSHMHDKEQSHWVISGSLEVTLDAGGRYVLGAGDRDFMSAATYHSARVLGEESCVYLVGSKKTATRRKARTTKGPSQAQILKELKKMGLT
jgi:mannose-6-phosphate isomerase-like protein (cupin superfamily)